MRPNESIIDIIDLKKGFEHQEVLRGVNLSIKRGLITSIIGKSGAGKSLLFRIIMGLMRPDSGSVIIDGTDIGRARTGKLNKVRSRMGFLFQSAALFDSLNVFENVALPLREKTSLKEADISDRVIEQLRLVGLEDAIEKHPSELSGGMKKRVGLARALVTRPEIVLFDEPTTGLDPVRKNEVHDLIQVSQRLYRYTAVIVSHEIPEIFDISDRVAMVNQGGIILEGKPRDFFNSTIPDVVNFLEGTEATRCHLTGLLVRPEFDARLTQEYERARRYDSRFSLLFVKLNFSKKTHDRGSNYLDIEQVNSVVRNVSHLLKECVRGSDFLARFRGDMFALILPNTSSFGAETLSKRIEGAIDEMDMPHWNAHEKRAYFGYSEYPDDNQPEGVVRKALNRLAQNQYGERVSGEKLIEKSLDPMLMVA